MSFDSYHRTFSSVSSASGSESEMTNWLVTAPPVKSATTRTVTLFTFFERKRSGSATARWTPCPTLTAPFVGVPLSSQPNVSPAFFQLAGSTTSRGSISPVAANTADASHANVREDSTMPEPLTSSTVVATPFSKSDGTASPSITLNPTSNRVPSACSESNDALVESLRMATSSSPPMVCRARSDQPEMARFVGAASSAQPPARESSLIQTVPGLQISTTLVRVSGLSVSSPCVEVYSTTTVKSLVSPASSVSPQISPTVFSDHHNFSMSGAFTSETGSGGGAWPVRVFVTTTLDMAASAVASIMAPMRRSSSPKETNETNPVGAAKPTNVGVASVLYVTAMLRIVMEDRPAVRARKPRIALELPRKFATVARLDTTSQSSCVDGRDASPLLA